MKDHRRGGLPSPYPAALGRRLLTIPLTWLLAGLAIVLFPLVGLAAVAYDLVTRRRGWPTARMVAFFATFLVIDVTSQSRILWVWLSQPFARQDWTHRNHELMHWWVGRLVRAARRVCGLRFEVEAPADLGPGPLVVLGQHESIVDAILPAYLVGTEHGRFVRYALTRGLRFDPCLDIVGHRIPNWFVARGAADNTAELAAMRTLATGMEGDEAAVIFPGGGLFTPERLAKAAARLAERGSPQASAAAILRNVMPPRPGGMLAYFDAAPDAHVLVIGHIGFEPLASIKRLWRTLPLREPVRVKVWRHERSEVPEGDERTLDWVYDRWAVMDDWIQEQR